MGGGMVGCCDWLRYFAAKYSPIKSRCKGAAVCPPVDECDSIVVTVVTDEGDEPPDEDDEEAEVLEHDGRYLAVAAGEDEVTVNACCGLLLGCWGCGVNTGAAAIAVGRTIPARCRPLLLLLLVLLLSKWPPSFSGGIRVGFAKRNVFVLRAFPLSPLALPVAAEGLSAEAAEELLLFCSTDEAAEPRPMEALLTRRIALAFCFRSRVCPVKLELRSFLELALARLPVEAEAVCSRDSESKFLTRVVSESRLALGCGELLTIDGFATGEPPPGGPLDTGIEELRLFSSDVSRRQLWAESGRLRLASFLSLLALVMELGPVDFIYRLPVLLFNDLLVRDPEGEGELLSCRDCCWEDATKFLPVGGFGATYPFVPGSGILLGLRRGVSGH